LQLERRPVWNFTLKVYKVCFNRSAGFAQKQIGLHLFQKYVIPGLDFRFHWSTVPIWLILAASALVFLGYVFIILVFKENSYASTIIQVEKEQPVITTGPYTIAKTSDVPRADNNDLIHPAGTRFLLGYNPCAALYTYECI